jgi:hypothetical protein
MNSIRPTKKKLHYATGTGVVDRRSESGGTFNRLCIIH